MSDSSPGLGHNHPPIAPQAAKAKSIALAQIEKAAAWDGIETVTSDQAGNLSDMISALDEAQKQVELRRKSDKAPHAEAAKAVDDAYRPIAAALARVKLKLTAVLAPYVAAQQRAAEEAAAEIQRRAAEEQRALRQAAEAERAAGDTIAAEAAAAEAKTIAADAARRAAATIKNARQVQSASGLGRKRAVRTRRVARLTNINQAFIAFRTDPRVGEVLTQIANERVRAKTYNGEPIPGFAVSTEETL